MLGGVTESCYKSYQFIKMCVESERMNECVCVCVDVDMRLAIA